MVSRTPSYNFVTENVRERISITSTIKTTMTSDESVQNNLAALNNDVGKIKPVFVWSKTEKGIKSQVISNQMIVVLNILTSIRFLKMSEIYIHIIY